MCTDGRNFVGETRVKEVPHSVSGSQVTGWLCSWKRPGVDAGLGRAGAMAASGSSEAPTPAGPPTPATSSPAAGNEELLPATAPGVEPGSSCPGLAASSHGRPQSPPTSGPGPLGMEPARPRGCMWRGRGLCLISARCLGIPGTSLRPAWGLGRDPRLLALLCVLGGPCHLSEPCPSLPEALSHLSSDALHPKSNPWLCGEHHPTCLSHWTCRHQTTGLWFAFLPRRVDVSVSGNLAAWCGVAGEQAKAGLA